MGTGASDWGYVPNVSEEEYNEVLRKLQEEIDKIDTPKEVAAFTGKVFLLVARIGLRQFGVMPFIDLATEIFSPNDKIVLILESLKK